jgi:cytochrome c biogenesis protein CcmG, thiol:disulfide interchange protein DsbE
MLKTRFILPLVAFVVLAAVLYIGVKGSSDNHIIASVLIGKPVPEFNLPSLTQPGTNLTSRSLHGKPYVLNVWGTWCGGCRQEHQSLMEIQQLGQVPIVGVNWRDDDDLAREWLQQLGNPYSDVGIDKQGRLAIDLGVYGAPETFLVDANGIIVHKWIGPLSTEIFKRDFLPKLSGAQATEGPS